MLTTFEVPRVACSGVGALEVANEDLANVSLVPDAVGLEVLEPGTSRFH